MEKLGRLMGTRAYHCWWNMVDRCTNVAQKSYRDYGGRGITVCERWRSFAGFYADMGDVPPGQSLDRIDNDGPYSPGNCRWATPLEQLQNTRKNRYVEYRGERITIAELSRRTGVDKHTLRYRLNRGMAMELVVAKQNYQHFGNKGAPR